MHFSCQRITSVSNFVTLVVIYLRFPEDLNALPELILVLVCITLGDKTPF